MVRLIPVVALGLVASAVLARIAMSVVLRWLRARRVRRSLGEAEEALEESAERLQTLAGELVLDAATRGDEAVATVLPASVARAELATIGAETTPPKGLALLIGSERVILEGPLQVLCGAVEATVKELGTGHDGPPKDAVRILHHGDPVVARGRLVRLADEREEHGYREGASTFALLPPDDADWPAHPITLAYEGVPRGPARRRGAAVASASTLAAVIALSAHGPPPPRVAVPAAPEPCIATLRAQLAVDATRVEARLDTCPDPLLAATTHWSLADFDAAAEAYLEARGVDPDLAPTVSEIEALALAGHLHPAAQLVRTMAHDWYSGPKSHEREQLICIADALDARGGPRRDEARATMAARSEEPGGPSSCRYLHGDLTFVEGHRDARLQGGSPWDDFELRQLLLAEVDTSDYFAYPEVIEGYPLSALWDPWAWVRLRPLAVEERVLERMAEGRLTLDGRRGAIAGYAAELALFHAYMGDRRRAHGALSQLEQTVGHAERRPFILGAIAAIHIGEHERAETFLEYGREDSHAAAKLRQVIATAREPGPVSFVHEIDTEPWSPNADLFRGARGGDADVVATTLEQHGSMGRETLPRIAPHLTTGMHSLKHWANARFPDPCRSCGLFALARHAGARREAARAVGDAELLARMSTRSQRLSEAILRRDLAFVFLLLERFADDPR